MKICWDNLEGVQLTKNGTFSKGTVIYVYKEACAKCVQPYLTLKSCQSKFCGGSCARSGKNNHMYGKSLSVELKKKFAAYLPHGSGALGSNYRGGVTKTGLTVYTTCKDKLIPYEEVREQVGTGLLEVKCAYCDRWYTPTYYSVNHRIAAINSLNKSECRLYCSENCKQACPTYYQMKYPKGFKHVTSREVNPYLRKLVLKRDNWTCQICGKTSKEAQLHVHHMDPVAQNPMFQNDADSCVTLCKGCHKMVHSRRGCRYIDLRCNRETDYTKNFKKEIRLKSTNSEV